MVLSRETSSPAPADKHLLAGAGVKLIDRARLAQAWFAIRFQLLRLLRYSTWRSDWTDVRLPLSGKFTLAVQWRRAERHSGAGAHLLSTWFRDFSTSRSAATGSARRALSNLVTVFFLCGLWAWRELGNFVIWGVWHG